jgi:hypothetical protein
MSSPIEGISILACTTGQLLGYQAFHGQPQPSELLPYFFAAKRLLRSGAAVAGGVPRRAPGRTVGIDSLLGYPPGRRSPQAISGLSLTADDSAWTL